MTKAPKPYQPMGFGNNWADWWKISTTNPLLRLICTLIGGLLLAVFLFAGAHSAFGFPDSPLLQIGFLVFAILLLICLFLDLRLAWSFPQFVEKNRALLMVHLVVGLSLGLFFAWRYGAPLVLGLPLEQALPLGFLIGLFGIAAAVPFTLGIAGPSRVSTLCAFGSVSIGAIFEGTEVLTRVEVWSLLFEVLSIEAEWITWAWTILLAICFLYDRSEDILEL